MNNLNIEIAVNSKGFPQKVIKELNIYKYEKLGINLRKIEIKNKLSNVSVNFTQPDKLKKEIVLI